MKSEKATNSTCTGDRQKISDRAMELISKIIMEDKVDQIESQ